jgi:N-acyl-D-aspartate/D-glutamate deacylase
VNRRQFAALALPLASTGLGIHRRRPGVVVQGPELVLVLRGGRHFRNGRWQTGDIGVDRAGKLRFGNHLPGASCFSVPGKVIAPGFIDILADNSTNPAATFPVFEKYKVTDGVTTALQMHGGSGDCRAYYTAMGGLPHRIHYGVSTFVMAIRSRFRSLAERRRQVEKNLEEGALGVSHSLEYQPAPLEELLAYAKLARRFDRPMFLHLRYSDRERELDGVDEAIALARASGARVHIAHLHSTGGTYRMEAALEKIRTGIAEGLCLTTCVYPYSYWATYLSSRRFDPGWQERFGLTYGDLRVVGSGECLTAESFARYRTTAALVAVPEGTMPLGKTFDRAIREDFCMIGSDGGIQREPRANSHPRGAGCFSTAVRHLMDTGMPLERILEKMTLLPRSVVLPALGERGVLEEGRAADLTLFDPATIRGTATVDNPNRFAAGIELVLVNGGVAYQDGALATRRGTAIRC